MNKTKSIFLHTHVISSLFKSLISSSRSPSACNFFNESASINNCAKSRSNNLKFHDSTRRIVITGMFSVWLTLLNRLLIFIVFPGISNPGPKPKSEVIYNDNKCISVFYQNVQGLIPFGSLTDQHPNLDSNKIFELHAYIYKNNPGVIILNETWLKPSILNTEILPNDYNVYRLDRSLQSHPIDPLNPNKFRRNGGGVLIAVNNKLTLQSKLIPVKCAAEMLAIELTLPDSTKIIISTCY